jgi:ubiquinone biosynthesis protein
MGIKKVSNFQRYKEIITVFAKNGLGFLFIRKTVFGRRNEHERILEDATVEQGLSVGERIRKTCEELGPTFIKFGQILSTRTDIITENVARELSALQDAVPPFPFEQAKSLIESEFNAKIEDIFEDFSKTPIASASMAQVYTARLHSGMKVAVKVQRPDIRSIVDIDVHILKSIARFIDRYTKYGEMYDFSGMVDEFAKVLEDELDFTLEAENTDRFRKNRAGDFGVTAPEVKWVYTTSKVLTMEHIDGIKITDLAALEQRHINPDTMARKFVGSLIEQMLSDGFFHADPHPGNLMIRDSGQIVFIDLGMMGELSERYKRLLTDLLIGLSLKNTRKVAQALVELGITRESVETKAFENSIEELLGEFLYVPLSEVSLMRVFMGLFELAARHRIKIPRAFSLIAKCLGTAQNIVEQLSPQLNMLEIAQQTAKRILMHSMGGENAKNALLSGAMDAVDIAKSLPSLIVRLLKKAESSDFVLEFRIKELEKIEKRMENVLNRMSFGIILLSISIILAGLIIAVGTFMRNTDSGGNLYSVSMFAIVIGLIVAIVIVAGIILSILFGNRRK